MRFNLLDEPWLPCLAPDGRRCELGVRDALARAHELACLRDGSPLVTAALHRLLLAILYRAVEGPKDEKELARLWGAGRFDSADISRYLDSWKERFDLFDPVHPFYQVADFEVPNPSPVAGLAQELSRGNNPVLFDHTVEDDAPIVSPAEAARRLVANQAFALAGLGVTTSNLFGKHPSRTHAPLVGGVTALLAGDTLFETLMLNLVVYSPEDDAPIPCASADAPAWERDEPPSPRTQTCRGYLDLLTWQSRCVRLLTEEGGTRHMYYAQGENMDAASRPRDPMWFYRLDKEGKDVPVRLDADRALWRSSDSLFAFSVGDGGYERRPLAFRHAANLRRRGILRERDLWRCSLLGLASDRAKVAMWAHEDLPVPTALLEEEELVSCVQKAVETSEGAARGLRGALFALARALLAFAGRTPAREDITTLTESLQHQAEPAFWSSLEVPFKRFLLDLPRGPDGATRAWTNLAKRSARQAFAKTAENAMGLTARELSARVKAEEILSAKLAALTQGTEGEQA